MDVISSQDFRNSYENFYIRMRNYLWSYDALKALAFVEDDIYTAFIDADKLRADLSKLNSFIKETYKDDEKLKKSYDELMNLLDIISNPESKVYSRINRVAEVNPDADKVVKLFNRDNEEDES